MTTYAVYDENNKLVSVGTVVASQLPNDLTVKTLTVEEHSAFVQGKMWNTATLSFDIDPPPPSPTQEDAIRDLLSALTDAQSLEEVRLAAQQASQVIG